MKVLTEEEKKVLRKLWISGNTKQKDLAKQFGVCVLTIHNNLKAMGLTREQKKHLQGMRRPIVTVTLEPDLYDFVRQYSTASAVICEALRAYKQAIEEQTK